MGRSFTAREDVKSWKEHTCVGCGGTYSYLLVRTVQATGRTPDLANAALTEAAAKTLARECDMQPCPTCGLYQPDMIGQRKSRKYNATFWLALLGFGIALLLKGTHALQDNNVSWILVAIGGLAGLRLLMISQDNPNADLEANRQIAQARVASGEVKQTPGKSGPGVEEFARPARSPLQWAIVLLVMAAIAPLAAPEMIRSSRSWTLNKDCYPPVVGPGDVARIYMPQKITSIKSSWRGTPTVFLHEPGATADKGIPVEATTNQNDWGTSINAKASERNTTSTPWVLLTFPADGSLIGKTMKCDIDLALEYPVFSGSSHFHRERGVMQQTATIHFSAPGAGAKYFALWWEGTLAGIAMILIGSLLLFAGARSFQRRAKPARIVT